MERIEAIKRIVHQLDEELVICNLGFPSRELYAVKDSAKHFYMLGSMGMASSLGLGLSLAQERKVIVLDGDGSILMNLGSLVTIFSQSPQNLLLIVLDNECYGSTGSQCTYAQKVDLKKVAESIGFKQTIYFKDDIALGSLLDADGPIFIHVKVSPGNASVPVIPLSPIEIKDRFMREVTSK